MTEFALKTEPYGHQAVEFYGHREDVARALLWEMRCGKTKPVIDTAAWLWSLLEIQGVLVLAPPGVHESWVGHQFPAHCPVPWQGHAWRASRKATRKHVKSITSLLAERDILTVLAVTHQGILSEDVRKIVLKFITSRRVMIVVDESHHYRRPSSKRTKRVRALAKRCAYRRILTGTATAEGPTGLFSQFELLEPGALGHRKFSDFKAEFFREEIIRKKNGDHFPKITPINEEELRERVAEWSSVVLRSDCHDMPPLNIQRHYFELSKRQAILLELVAKEAVDALEAEGIDIDVENGLKRLSKLRQLTSGFIIDDAGETQDATGGNDTRSAALLDVMKTKPGKVIVWAVYREDFKRIARTMEGSGIPYVEYHGSISEAGRAHALDAFRGQVGTRVFVANPASAGEGLNLSQARTMVWYSHPIKQLERTQANMRASEIGGEPVDVIDLVGIGGTDEKLLAMILDKVDTADFFTGKGLRDFLMAIFGGIG